MAENKTPEFEPPQACVQRVIKAVLPDNVQIGKDAKAAFSRSAGIFIMYLTACANDFCREAKRQTISAQDVMQAIKELEFGELEEPLKEYLDQYRREASAKKQIKAMGGAAAAAAAAAKKPGSGGVGDTEVEPSDMGDDPDADGDSSGAVGSGTGGPGAGDVDDGMGEDAMGDAGSAAGQHPQTGVGSSAEKNGESVAAAVAAPATAGVAGRSSMEVEGARSEPPLQTAAATAVAQPAAAPPTSAGGLAPMDEDGGAAAAVPGVASSATPALAAGPGVVGAGGVNGN